MSHAAPIPPVLMEQVGTEAHVWLQLEHTAHKCVELFFGFEHSGLLTDKVPAAARTKATYVARRTDPTCKQGED